jgi:hypothetical protein
MAGTGNRTVEPLYKHLRAASTHCQQRGAATPSVPNATASPRGVKSAEKKQHEIQVLNLSLRLAGHSLLHEVDRSLTGHQ